jgi:hypothetical protein
MDAAWRVRRARWRYRGAWLWRLFGVLAVADGVIGHLLPLSTGGQSIPAGVIVGLVLNLLAVVLLSRPLGALLRRRRGDLPAPIARDYAGTFCVCAVTAGFVAVGLAVAPSLRADNGALRDALVRAEAYIGAHAPTQFRHRMEHPSTFTIQPDSVYRTCVLSDDGTRTYCVIVRRSLPLARSVVFDGYTPNSVFAAGAS